MKTENPALIISVNNQSGAEVKKGTFVDNTGSSVNTQNSPYFCVGVCNADTDDGEEMPVMSYGVALVKSGAAINVGDSLYANGDSVFPIAFSSPPTTAEVLSKVGFALDSVSAAGEYIRVLIK